MIPNLVLAPPELEFDEARHEYRLGGRLVDGVTGLLGTIHRFDMVPPAILAAAQERGTNAHIACQFWDEDGDVDTASLTPDTVLRLGWWREFLADYRPQFVGIETRLYHRALRYAGTADRFAVINGQPWVIDIKTALQSHPVWGMQTAAYAQAAGWGNAKRATVQLLTTGYRFIEWPDPTDWNAFASLLTLQRWLKKSGA
jgi:hypothetical protein